MRDVTAPLNPLNAEIVLECSAFPRDDIVQLLSYPSIKDKLLRTHTIGEVTGQLSWGFGPG